MSYIGITESQSNPFSPLTSELVKQLRDNPIAIANGSAGAPVTVQGWHGINQTAHDTGDASALIWSHAVDGNLTSIEIDPIAAGYEYRIVFEDIVSTGSTECSLVADLFADGAYITNSLLIARLTTLTPSADPDYFFDSLRRRLVGGASLSYLGRTGRAFHAFSFGAFKQGVNSPPSVFGNETLTPFSEASGLALAANDTPSKFRLRMTANQLSDGKLWVYKRRIGGL